MGREKGRPLGDRQTQEACAIERNALRASHQAQEACAIERNA